MKRSTRRILDALQQAGDWGCSDFDLRAAAGGGRFLPQLLELRGRGYVISTTREGRSGDRYRLLHEPGQPPAGAAWATRFWCFACGAFDVPGRYPCAQCGDGPVIRLVLRAPPTPAASAA